MRQTLPLLLVLCAACALPAAAADTLSIGQVQGREARSPYVGREVRVSGVVTAAVEGERRGWFLQGASDGDPATSDGLFVLAEGARLAGLLAVGDAIEVRGEVVELEAGQGSLTALRAVVQTLHKTRLRLTPAKPAAIAAPPADWEAYEGMQVRIAVPLTVAGTHRLERDGELLLNFGDRLRTPTDVALPGAAANALRAENLRRSLRLDDGSLAERPATIGYLPASGAPRTGSRVTRLEGVIDQRGGGYLLQPTRRPDVRPAPAPRPPRVGGDVRVAGFNLENFFNGDGRGGGFPTPRGARTPAEFEAQLARLVATIRGLDPDIAALMELENDGFGPESAIVRLVDALNAGGGDWRFVATAAPQGGDQIRVGLIYRASRVTPTGEAATLVDDVFGTRSRPPLAQSFRAGPGPVFTVVANHFKSKGCSEATGPDTDQKDGQGCWNPIRTESARRLDAWLRTDPTRSGSDLTLIIGDLNANTMEDPVRTLVAAGWRDALAGSRDATPYSYVFDGQIGRIDHALLSPALAARLAGAAEWHSNADEPDARGYQTRPELRGPWRSSDHDPMIVGLRLRTP
jgi:hypothetical protein